MASELFVTLTPSDEEYALTLPKLKRIAEAGLEALRLYITKLGGTYYRADISAKTSFENPKEPDSRAFVKFSIAGAAGNVIREHTKTSKQKAEALSVIGNKIVGVLPRGVSCGITFTS